MAGFPVAALLTLTLLAPWLVPFVLRQSGALVGWWISQKTDGRRQTLLRYSHSAALKHDRFASSSDHERDSASVEQLSSSSNATTNAAKSWKGIVGFFHPFCNAGGGGERVLWAAIRATQRRWPEAICVVYTGDHDANKDQIVKRVQDRFNITLNPSTVHFIYLSTRRWVLASTWPHFTLLGQSFGSIILALDAFNMLVPDIFVDTMGYAFSLWLCKFLFPSVPTGAYVHYPTISTDMLESLDSEGEEHGMNAGAGKGSRGKAKIAYWRFFAGLYSRVGGSIDVIMTNSSWTQSHIQQLWGPYRRNKTRAVPTVLGKQHSGQDGKVDREDHDISVVFPPVAVEDLESQIEVTSDSKNNREPHLLYIAQFRPEKNHSIIVNAFAKLITSRTWTPSDRRPKLVLVGSVRDDDDKKRVYKLRLLAHELQIKNDVEFVCDASWPQVLHHLRSSSVGVNGMWNEHFGIGVVEYQAAGLISVVNDSGGPKLDIVVDINGGPTGFHASTADEYAAAFAKALDLDEAETLAMRQRARESAKRFTEQAFAEKWISNMETLIQLHRARHSKCGS